MPCIRSKQLSINKPMFFSVTYFESVRVMNVVAMLFLLVLPTGCKHDVIIPPIITEPDCVGVYEDYSTSNFDYVKRHLIPSGSGGIFFTFPEPYLYENPVFNPCNPYEIAYSRKVPTELEGEVWTFDFCTGEAKMVSDNFYYNLDWGYNGWLLYTGEGHQIFKVKANGDSLIQLSILSGFNRAGKWDPSGSLFWLNRDWNAESGGYNIYDVSGAFVKVIENTSFHPMDWYNDSIMIGREAGASWATLSLLGEELVQISTNEFCHSCSFSIDMENLLAYGSVSNGVGQTDYFLRHNLSGTNTIDTLGLLYDSYTHIHGDYANNKIVTSLYRQHWQDSIINARYARWNILIMDADGTNERLVELP